MSKDSERKDGRASWTEPLSSLKRRLAGEPEIPLAEQKAMITTAQILTGVNMDKMKTHVFAEKVERNGDGVTTSGVIILDKGENARLLQIDEIRSTADGTTYSGLQISLEEPMELDPLIKAFNPADLVSTVEK